MGGTQLESSRKKLNPKSLYRIHRKGTPDAERGNGRYNPLDRLKECRPKEGELGNGRTVRIGVRFIPSWKYFLKNDCPDYKQCRASVGLPGPSLIVVKVKNRCIPYIYWAAAIFSVVPEFSILYLCFFLNCSHVTFANELIIRSETENLMKIIGDHFTFIQRHKSLLL